MSVVPDQWALVVVAAMVSIGLWGMLAASNLVRKLVGMVVFQSAIFLFFILGGVKDGGTTPVIDAEHGVEVDSYVNPLPHLLILTAIVVGVAVLGVGVALLLRVHEAWGTLEEPEILERLNAPTSSTTGSRPDPGARSSGDPP